MSATPVKTSAVQMPTTSVDNHTQVLKQLKEGLEVAQRLRGDPGDSYVRVSELVDAGLVRLDNGQVQPASKQSTGWGTPTGGAIEANFDGASATLTTCTAAVAQIIAALKAAGILGT